MLQEVFYWVFNMSITAAVTGLVIMLIRAVKRIPRRVAVLLWSIPFLRMAVPLALNRPYSLMAILNKLSMKTVVVYQPNDDISFSMINSVMAADTYFPIMYKTNVLEAVFRVASAVWLVGALVILFVLAVAYFRAMREIRDATHLRDNIYCSKKVVAPAIYGIVKPKIVLPASDWDEELVILHEKTHIRSFDNLWRMLALVTVAVHWFNPLCWLFLKGFLAELELSCDERVLAKIGNHRAKEYARTLLESRHGATVVASAFGGAKIRTRIENILSFRKLTWLSLGIFVVLIGALFYGLLTNGG